MHLVFIQMHSHPMSELLMCKPAIPTRAQTLATDLVRVRGIFAKPNPWNIWGFPRIRGTVLGVPIIRTIVFWGLEVGVLYSGKLPYEL